jgi:hypothetical protein
LEAIIGKCRFIILSALESGLKCVPLVVSRQFFQVAHALATEMIREVARVVDNVFAGKT